MMQGRKTYAACVFILCVVAARYFEVISAADATAGVTAGIALALAGLRDGMKTERAKSNENFQSD